MLIRMKLCVGEQQMVRLLNWLVGENVILLANNPSWPTLYESHMRYEIEKIETWSDYGSALAQGVEDCDALSAMRAADLIVRPERALRPGDEGYDLWVQLGRPKVRAEAIMTTRVRPGRSGLYHCITRYWIGGKSFHDDPSARLGMYDRRRRA